MTFAFGFFLTALLAFANGSNDISKSVATLVGSGVTDYRRALRWGTAWTIIGSMLAGWLGLGLAQRFAESLGAGAAHHAAIPLSVVAASLAWVAFASRTGLPVSTTHAITGGIVGAGWIAEGLSPWARTDIFRGFLIPLLASPFMALALTFVLRPAVARAKRWLDDRCACVVPVVGSVGMDPGGGAAASPMLHLIVDRPVNCEGRSAWSWSFQLDSVHWVSSGLVALSRGMNDAPKIWALMVPLFLLSGKHGRFSLPASIIVVAFAMGLGSWVAGRNVTEVLAQRVTRMNHQEGLAANLSTAFLVAAASRLGLPVSTTHVSSGAIVGVGLGRSQRDINWPLLGEMALAWFVTLPATALTAVACYRLFG